MDCVRRVIQELTITPEGAQDINYWRSGIRATDRHLMGKGEEEEEV